MNIIKKNLVILLSIFLIKQPVRSAPLSFHEVCQILKPQEDLFEIFNYFFSLKNPKKSFTDTSKIRLTFDTDSDKVKGFFDSEAFKNQKPSFVFSSKGKNLKQDHFKFLFLSEKYLLFRQKFVPENLSLKMIDFEKRKLSTLKFKDLTSENMNFIYAKNNFAFFKNIKTDNQYIYNMLQIKKEKLLKKKIKYNHKMNKIKSTEIYFNIQKEKLPDKNCFLGKNVIKKKEGYKNEKKIIIKELLQINSKIKKIEEKCQAHHQLLAQKVVSREKYEKIYAYDLKNKKLSSFGKKNDESIHIIQKNDGSAKIVCVKIDKENQNQIFSFSECEEDAAGQIIKKNTVYLDHLPKVYHFGLNVKDQILLFSEKNDENDIKLPCVYGSSGQAEFLLDTDKKGVYSYFMGPLFFYNAKGYREIMISHHPIFRGYKKTDIQKIANNLIANDKTIGEGFYFYNNAKDLTEKMKNTGLSLPIFAEIDFLNYFKKNLLTPKVSVRFEDVVHKSFSIPIHITIPDEIKEPFENTIMVDIHGGPEVFYRLDDETRMFFGCRIPFVTMNFPGSKGYGFEYQKALSQNWYKIGEYVGSVLDHLKTQYGYGEKTQFILRGFSFGAYGALATWMQNDQKHNIVGLYCGHGFYTVPEAIYMQKIKAHKKSDFAGFKTAEKLIYFNDPYKRFYFEESSTKVNKNFFFKSPCLTDLQVKNLLKEMIQDHQCNNLLYKKNEIPSSSYPFNIMFSYGEKDSICPPQETLDMLKVLEQKGYKPKLFKTSEGHFITQKLMEEELAFFEEILQQKKALDFIEIDRFLSLGDKNLEE